MTFWIVSIAVAAACSALILRAALRARNAGAQENADLKVYRDQLAEVERDAERGVIDAAEAERLRIEISRRILEADRKWRASGSGSGGVAVPLVAVLTASVGAFALYMWVGAPGYPDLPIAERISRAEEIRASRPSQAEAMAQIPPAPAPEADPAYVNLVERLRKAVAANPDDPQGQRLLARNEAALGNYDAAIAAQRRLIELLGDNATATDYATLADIYVLAAGGYVSPEAENALAQALQLDPKNGMARFYMGLMWAQTGRPDLAFRFWKPLLDEGPEDAPWIPPIRSQIELVARAAGVDYTPMPPAGSRGPDAAAMAAAADMTPEEREAMIRSMVDGLSERLATEGGPAEDWARLITSLSVLGETDRARQILAEAQSRFAEHPQDLQRITEAAQRAGLAQ